MGKIEQHFTRELIGLEMSSPPAEAARLMRDNRVGAVAVRDGSRVVGLVTERDLLGCLLAGETPGGKTIGKWVRRNLPTVKPSASESECSNLMRDHNTRHLLVEDAGQIVGIISMRDVIRMMLDEKQFLIEQLQNYIRS